MEAKNIPYGLADFARIQRDNYYYVDKTEYIPRIEQAESYFFLARPRRFGKSLFINMLTWYYDINRKDRFGEVFVGCHILDNPTAEQGRYLILSFDFSDVNPMPDKVFESFEQHCGFRFMEFADNYARFFAPGFRDELMAQPSADAKFAYLISKATTLNLPIYLFIDEYDNFANDILARKGQGDYNILISEDSFFQRFFARIKAGTIGDRAIKRAFITGISPIVRKSVGFGTDMSDDVYFNGLMGFYESELTDMLEYYDSELLLSDPIDKIMEIITLWCGGCCFSDDAIKVRIYNPVLTLYFLNYYIPHKEVPYQMVDGNVYSDYAGLRHFIRTNRLSGMYASIMEEVVGNGMISAGIDIGYPVESLVWPDNFKSLLYYFGLLFPHVAEHEMLMLGIPNFTVRHQVYSLLIEAYNVNNVIPLDLSALSDLVVNMAYKGEWEPVFRYLASELERQDQIRDFIEGEAHVKSFLMAYLGMVNGYIIRPEYEATKGYDGFYMMPDRLHQPLIAYSYIVKVTYLRVAASDGDFEDLRNEAVGQLQRYAADPLVAQTKYLTQLGLILLIFRGKYLELCEKVELPVR